MHSQFSLSLGLALLLVGCVDRPAQDDDGGDGSEPSGGTTATTATTVPPVTTSSSTTAVTDSSGGGVTSVGDDSSSGDPMTSAGFICLDDDEHWHCAVDAAWPAFECDPWAQDCIDGQKCMPWANDGGLVWNATHCTDIAPGPAQPGEPCTVVGSAVSGFDSCAQGSMCWNVDPATNEGECVALCTGDEVEPICDDPSTRCTVQNDGAIIVCLPACDPLLADCGLGFVCAPTYDAWSCVPDVSTPVAIGQACAYNNACESGLVCAQAEVSPMCDGAAACCVPLCDTTAPLCPDPATQCVPWYGPEEPWQPVELGICSAVPDRPREGWVDLTERVLTSDPG